MQIPDRPLTLTKTEAATRQVEAAIEAFKRGDFDIAITLVGAAEGMLNRTGPHLFAYLCDHPKVQELDKGKEWVPHLNLERDWLKHSNGPQSLEVGASATAFMIARAASKLEHWTLPLEAFRVWLVENLDTLTE